MKKRVKILLWILWIIILLLAWVYCYMKYIMLEPIYVCPMWYRPIISIGDEACTDCELTRKQIRRWETPDYNEDCLSISKTCYICSKPAPKDCDCANKGIYVKIE